MSTLLEYCARQYKDLFSIVDDNHIMINNVMMRVAFGNTYHVIKGVNNTKFQYKVGTIIDDVKFEKKISEIRLNEQLLEENGIPNVKSIRSTSVNLNIILLSLLKSYPAAKKSKDSIVISFTDFKYYIDENKTIKVHIDKKIDNNFIDEMYELSNSIKGNFIKIGKLIK